MMRKYVFTFALSMICFLSSRADNTLSFTVSEQDISNGYVNKKIWLQHYAAPTIKITNLTYVEDVDLPDNAIPSHPSQFDLLLGIERKRPFVVIQIPAYTKQDGSSTKVKRLALITISVAEKPATTNIAASKLTAAGSSVLASGSWHKIAVSESGFYKVDFAFVSSKLGISSGINTSKIRVFGNGGYMLRESNSIPAPYDLTENPIWINDANGNGSFDAGDYFVFYAVGPTEWVADMTNKRFNHIKNIYHDKSYYFLNFDAPGKRISSENGPSSANVTVTSFNDYAVHDEDLANPAHFGKTWWGEDFSKEPGKVDTRNFDLNTPGITSDPAHFHLHLASRAPHPLNSFSVTINGQLVATENLGASAESEDDRPVADGHYNYQKSYSGSKATVTLKYQSGINSGIGYLGFIEINYRRSLAFTDARLSFRDLNSIASGNIAAYQIGNADGNTQVWDVTNPLSPIRINGTLNGSTYNFTRDASTLHEFAAFKNSELPLPEYISNVANQDLHGFGQTDYIIVTHSDFLNAANRLADFHRQRSNMKIAVATTSQVYNEFSSGAQDISAIRDFTKMFYDRAIDTTEMPKYLLLFGDASYDYKDRLSNNTNYVPTFETAEYLAKLSAFCNDDFFGFLDTNENIEKLDIVNTLDVGVGRLPAKTLVEANTLVDKILRYKSPESLGPWRLSVTLAADNRDGAGDHMGDAETMDVTVTNNSNIYNSSKVYLDAIPMISTPGGLRAPDANKMINDQVFKGTFLVNYSGHGNYDVLAHERIIAQDDYTKWKNLTKMPFMVTATCDFGPFDQAEFVSAGEKLVLKEDGGVITLLTTTGLVYSDPNRRLNAAFLDAQFKHVNGKWNTFGDAFRIGKNKTYADLNRVGDYTNFRKFALLGDPALEPNFPEFFISTDSVLDGATGLPTDTIKALGEYIFKGSVTDVNSNVLTGFNGRFYVTIYDKPRVISTITPATTGATFKVRNNIIYRGKATVTNGKFSFSFITPKDINYDFGKGKVSQYAENGVTDAAGADTTYAIGGYSDHPRIENNPPIVRPFIEDSLFQNGGLTGPNTLLFAILEDETGINVSGSSVGHDLTAVLDGDIEHPYILNDYYETAPNTYKRGYVNFPISDLPDGHHRLTVKAWDVNNNSGEGSIDFIVVRGEIVQLNHLMNYPNPFKDLTHFVFEHNHPDEPLNVEIKIYNMSSVLLQSINKNFTPTGSRSNEITWDGTDFNGVKLPSGVYAYRFKITTEKGILATAYQKLVIVR
jgi:hypothetical protein